MTSVLFFRSMFDLIDKPNVRRDSQQMHEQILKGSTKSLLLRGMTLAMMLPALVTLPVVASDLSVVAEQAATDETAEKQTTRRRIARPAPPRRQLPPNRVQPGGGLDIAAYSCTPGGAPLTALVPVENPVFTARDRPTFLFHLPDAPEAVDHAEFILLSADEKEEIHSVQFSPTASGIVSISLPAESEKVLEPGEAYHWYLNLHCQTAVGIPSVNGWVQRVASEDVAELSVGSELPSVWYDEVAQTAASLRQLPSAGDSVLAQWSSLLMAAELDELIDISVLGSISRSEVAVVQEGE